MYGRALALAALAAALALAAPGASAADPPLMLAQEYAEANATLPPGVDTVEPGSPVRGWRGWRGAMYGESDSLTHLRIALDRADPRWVFDRPVAFPISMEVPTLDRYTTFELRDIAGWGSAQVDQTFAPGVGIARTVSLTRNDDGTTTAHVRVATRVVDSRWGPGASVFVSLMAGSSLASLDDASLVLPSGASKSGWGQGYVQWSLPPSAEWAVATADVTLPAGFGDTTSYRPYVSVFLNSFSQLDPVEGTSAAVADEELGGTWTFSADQQAHWQLLRASQLLVQLPSVVPPPPPPAPPLYASIVRTAAATVPADAGGVSATQAYPGSWSWMPQLWAPAGFDIPSPAISLDRVASSWTDPWSPLPPFPIRESAATLYGGTNFPFDPRYDAVDKPLGSRFGFRSQVTTGYDLTRTTPTDVVPPGGARQHWSVTLTLRDGPFDRPQVMLQVEGGVVPSSVVPPVLGDGERLVSLETQNGLLYWSAGSAVVGKPYTIAFDLDVPNAAPLPVLYRPPVWAFATTRSAALPSVVGSSAAIADDVLGGTFTFSAGVPIQWYRNTSGMNTVSWGRLGPTAVADRVTLRDAADAAAALGVTAAADDLRQAVDPALWLDDEHPASATGQHVFRLAKSAFQRLGTADAPAVGGRTTESVQRELYVAAHRLAFRAISEATAAHADSPSLEAAKSQLLLGERGMTPDAIDHLKNAWNDALQALRGVAVP